VRAWIRWLLAPLFVLATTAVGAVIGFAVASGIWEAANPNHAPENFASGLWGSLLGAPVGGIIGFIIGLVVVARWPEHPSNNA